MTSGSRWPVGRRGAGTSRRRCVVPAQLRAALAHRRRAPGARVHGGPPNHGRREYGGLTERAPFTRGAVEAAPEAS
eukprot:5224399-Pyramimonas_sp.AAC.1